MAKESNELTRYRTKWVGKKVELDGVTGLVVGVCDDGARCDHDARRRAKPTGELIVQAAWGEKPLYWLDELVRVVE